ncbi:hypothetical protein [uncultured Campylobacter sp.]|uniref:hypothetical protein n=1 Tax=uncultured Campylobacter sp. TaxID=218934 RepID=UPI00261545BE|nr:hypothetical protein [uncultured Campylobacter sp.]
MKIAQELPSKKVDEYRPGIKNTPSKGLLYQHLKVLRDVMKQRKMKSKKLPKRHCLKETCKLGILCFCAPWLPEISRDYTANLLLTGSNR